jgi:3-deoxy-7-phosphoheptulonate synthase
MRLRLQVFSSSSLPSPSGFQYNQKSLYKNAFSGANMSHVDDLNIVSQEILISPSQLQRELPITATAADVVTQGRQAVRDILDRKDHRLMVVIGPCSIHDPIAAMDYARRLKALAEKVSDTLCIVMRVYFEKPRTTVGWKGLINDPYLNDSFKIAEGLHVGRKLLLDIAELGLPSATEALDPISPQYLQDLISWSAIGARTTESQTHREMASGLSSAVGFKNGTDGSLGAAINSLQSISSPHRFLGINKEGQVSIVTTRGNPYGHVVLRGGNGKPNYDSVSVAMCEKELRNAGVSNNIMVDCSHANSDKNHELQPLVLDNVANQILEGNKSIIGVMIESNIGEGNQKISSDLSQLKYGVSVTDACIGWETTEQVLTAAAEKLRNVLPNRN